MKSTTFSEIEIIDHLNLIVPKSKMDNTILLDASKKINSLFSVTSNGDGKVIIKILNK